MWIEINKFKAALTELMSRLARALWIEILLETYLPDIASVEARESLVD